MDGKIFICDREPDYVNKEGTKWWKDDQLTKYARRSGEGRIKLEKVTVCAAEFKNGKKCYVILDDGKIIFESIYSEAIAIRLDLIRLGKIKIR